MRRKRRAAQSEPFFEDVEFAEDMLPGPFHGEAAEQQDGGVEEEDRRQQHGMPVADLAKGFGVHAHACLARVKQRHEHDKEHHVAGQCTENKGAGAMQGLARAAPRTSPLVVAPAAPASGGPAVDGRLATGSRRLALDLMPGWA